MTRKLVHDEVDWVLVEGLRLMVNAWLQGAKEARMKAEKDEDATAMAWYGGQRAAYLDVLAELKEIMEDYP